MGVHISFILRPTSKKYNRQVITHPNDSIFQKILFRWNINHTIKGFVINRVAWLFLVLRSFYQVAIDEGVNFPLAKIVLPYHYYVVDLFSGVKTRLQAVAVISDLIALLKKYYLVHVEKMLQHWCDSFAFLWKNQLDLVGKHFQKLNDN